MRAFLIGLVAGGFGSLLGLGGGVLIVPALTGWLGLRQHQAHGTSAVAVAATAVVGAFTYASGGYVDYKAALLLTLGAVFAARAGARFSKKLSAKELRRAFGAFLLLVSLLLPFKDHLPHVRS